jgi:hypothetical protein
MNSKDNLQPHPSLPARPPPSTYSAPPSRNLAARGYGGNAPAAYGAFAQAAAPTMYSQPTVSAPYQPTAYPTSNTYYNPNQAYGSAAPATAFSTTLTATRGFPPSGLASSGFAQDEDAVRLAEWNTAYVRDDVNAKKGGNTMAATRAEANSTPDPDAGAAGNGKQKTVVREGGGKTWEDASLLEWNPLHPRLFIGNLAGEVTDDSLLKAFSKYPSVSKARVVRDKRSTKSKSYGFVSFSDTDDYFRAAKEMQGKYIGSHPVLIKRATSEVKASTKREDKHGKYGKNKNNKSNKKPSTGAASAMPGVVPYISSGIQKKGKTGGPRVLG